MTHTDYSTPELFDKFYCAKVSHHHYWFETYREYYEFTKSNWYDLRMTLSTPNNPTERV
jgi:hypothetical protein